MAAMSYFIASVEAAVIVGFLWFHVQHRRKPAAIVDDSALYPDLRAAVDDRLLSWATGEKKPEIVLYSRDPADRRKISLVADGIFIEPAGKGWCVRAAGHQFVFSATSSANIVMTGPALNDSRDLLAGGNELVPAPMRKLRNVLENSPQVRDGSTNSFYVVGLGAEFFVSDHGDCFYVSPKNSDERVLLQKWSAEGQMLRALLVRAKERQL